MHDTLTHSIHTTRGVLSSRLDNAAGSIATTDRPRDRFPAVDMFLASASRHVAAANAVLVPAARKRLPDGAARVHAFSRRSRRLEFAMAQTKAKLYGEAHAIHRPWPEIWVDLRDQLGRWLDLEESLAADLVRVAGEGVGGEVAVAFYRAEVHAPTRPHPYVPHLGLGGKVARRVTRRVDLFWDMAEGRMVPEPVHPHDRSHDGRLTQYFLADPHLERLEDD